MKKVLLKNIREEIKNIRAGDEIYLSGRIYTARDAAHKKLFGLLESGKPLPFDIKDAAVYYAGPTPAPKINPAGVAIGACGPTTSKRMDIYTPKLLEAGLACMIGKGPRSAEVCEAICRYGAVYFAAIGGAGAIYAKHIISARVAAFEELGCESVKELIVEDFPVYAAIDINGGNLYDIMCRR